MTLTVRRLTARIKELEGQLELASIDEVTGLPNRRRLERELEIAWANFDRNPLQQLSLLMIDIDNFKKVNDDWGHEVGDRALRDVSDIIKRFARKTDIFGRFGGEEFIMAVRTDQARGGVELAERLRKAIVRSSNPDRPKVSVSIGVYCAGDCPDLERAKKAADLALFAAKAEGRNRVVIGHGPGTLN